MMQFIILGYVPGTDIQIGFDLIMRVGAVLALFYLLSIELRANTPSNKKIADFINAISI